MYNILVAAHSGLRWIVLILMLLAVIKAWGGYSAKKNFGDGDRKIVLFSMIFYHTQWLLGLVLYFTSPRVTFVEGFMKDTITRFYAIEHIFGMTVAMILITIGYSKMKKAEDSEKKFKTVRLWYTLAIIIVLASIPWPFHIPTAGWM